MARDYFADIPEVGTKDVQSGIDYFADTEIPSTASTYQLSNIDYFADDFQSEVPSNSGSAIDYFSGDFDVDVKQPSPRPVSPAIRPPVGKDVKPGVREAPMPQMEAVMPEQELIDQASQEQRLLDTIPEDDESPLGKFVKAWKRGQQVLQAESDVGRATVGVDENLPELLADPVAMLQSIGDRTMDADDLERLKPLVARQIAQEGLDPIEGSNKLATGIYSAAAMMGGKWETIAKSWDDALAGMAVGAKFGSTALAAGAVPGALGISVGAAGGFMTGLTVGTAKEWYFQGVGQIYRDMIKDGIDPDISKDSALVGAVPYAASEFLFSQFLGGVFAPKKIIIGKLTKGTFAKGVLRIAKETAKNHLLREVPMEVAEEGIQSLITDTSNRVGTYIHNLKWNDTKEALDTRDMMERSMDTMIQSALPIALMMAPGGGVNFTRNAMRLQEQKSLITDADKQQANLSEQFGQENVTRVNPTTLAVTTPQGTMRMQFEDDLTKSALENPEGFLDSIRAQSKRGAEAVSKAIKQAEKNAKKDSSLDVTAEAADILMENDEYAPKGKTVANAEITDEQGNTVTVDQLISLETGFATGGTAQHEIWHALKGLMQITPAEQAELDNRLGIDPALVSEAKREEIEAYALENYSDRMNVGAFGRVLDFIDKFLGGYKEVNEPLGQAVERVRDAMLQRKQTEGLNTEAEKYPTLTDEEKAIIGQVVESAPDVLTPSEQAVETVTEPAQAGETVMEEAIAPTTDEIAPVEDTSPVEESQLGQTTVESEPTAGSPTFYHESDVEFDEFDDNKIGTSRDEGFMGRGFYFSTDPKIVREGKVSVKRNLDIQNPLRLRMPKWGYNKSFLVADALGIERPSISTISDDGLSTRSISKSDAVKIRDEAIRQGYDSVELNYSDLGYNNSEVVVFDKAQIIAKVVKKKPAKKLTRPELRAKATELGVSDKGGNQALRKRIETAEKPKAEKKVEAKAKPEAKAEVEDNLVGKEVRIGSRTLKVLKALPQSEVEKEAGEQFYQLKDTKTGQVIEEERESLNTKAKTLSEMTRKEISAEAKKQGIQIQKGDSKSFVANLIRQKAKREKAGTKFSVSQPPLNASEIRENKDFNVNQELSENAEVDSMLDEDIKTPNKMESIRDVDSWNRVTKFFLGWMNYGKLYVANKEAYKDFILAQHEASSSNDIAIASTDKLADKIAEKTGQKDKSKLYKEGDHKIAFAFEEKENDLDARQKVVMEYGRKRFKALERMEKVVGTYEFGRSKEGVEQSIEWLKSEIAMQEKLKGTKGHRITKDLSKLGASLKKMQAHQERFDGYAPHHVIVRKFRAMEGKARSDFTRKLEIFVTERKGMHSLRDFAEGFKGSNGRWVEPILTHEDLNPFQMIAEATAESYKRIAMKQLYDSMVARGYIVNANVAPRNQGWVRGVDMKGVSPKRFGEKMVHPLIASAFTELAQANSINQGAFRKLLAITKVGQFFVPGIVITYDIMQKYQRGMWSLNPVKEAIYWQRAWHSMVNKDAVWKAAHRYGTSQKPSVPTHATEQQALDKFGQYFDETVKGKWKVLSKIFDQKMEAPESVKSLFKEIQDNPTKLLDAIMLPYRAIGKGTWTGDDLIRMQSFHALLDMHGEQYIKGFQSTGLSRNEALRLTYQKIADYAGKAHGGYALPSKPFKDVASLFLFVHTFRLLMPWEHIKSLTTIPKMMVNKIRTGEQLNQADLEIASKALVSSLATPVLLFMMMTANGWEPDDEGLPEWWKTLKKGTMQHWKFKKTVRGQDGKKREIVTGINTIINMPTKWIERFIKEKPEKLNDVSYHIANAFKWEINPMYRNFLDVATNTSSMGGTTPYQVGDKTSKQVYDAAKYFFDNTFRLYGEMSRPEMSGAYQRQVKSDLEGALNGFEKVMLGYFTGYKGLAGKFAPLQVGYTYSRKDRRARYGSARQALARAISAEIGNISSTYADRPEIRRKKTRELKKLQREREKRLRDIFLGDKT